MVDTRRTLAALQTLHADNTAGDISPQDNRDFLFSVFGAGLETNAQTVTTTDITGAVGQFYVCTIAGLTADRNLTLPSAAVDERIGVHVVDGDASFELVLIGAASQTINGGAAATEWSRVFIPGETVIFRCTAANSWVVEYDGRKPCIVSAYLSTDTDLTQSAGTAYEPVDQGGAWTVPTNTGDCFSSSDSKFTWRRLSDVFFVIRGRPASTAADQKYAICQLKDQAAALKVYARLTASGASDRTQISAQGTISPAAIGDWVQYTFINEDANEGWDGTQSTTIFLAEERF